MARAGKHGVTTTTPENILFGAGTFHKNLVWNSEKSEWEGTIIGATSGGGKVGIEGELFDIELDGALVKVKGLTVKNGGRAYMEINMAELTGDNIKMTTRFTDGESDATGYQMYVDKPNIEEGDYIENFGFVGLTANGKKTIVVIFENALCTSAMELEAKNKENSTLKATLEAYAENDGDLDTLPVKIYYPETVIV